MRQLTLPVASVAVVLAVYVMFPPCVDHSHVVASKPSTLASGLSTPDNSTLRRGPAVLQPPRWVNERKYVKHLGRCLGSGSWVPSPPGPELLAYDSCPWLQSNYRCNASHRARIARWVYQPPAECELLRLEDSGVGRPGPTCLSGKRISIVGDSLMHEVLHSLECRLQKHVVSRELLNTFELRGSVYEKKVRVTFENGMLIEYTFIGDDRQMHPLESTFRSKTFWTMANVSADVVITNLGVFHLTDLEYQREARTRKIMSYGEELAKIPGRIVVFGASSKHVNDRGPYVCGQDDLTDMNLMQAWASTQVEGLISHKGAALEWMALQHGFDFVSIEPMTRARIDAHISRKDCSHYCLPGIPDLWLDMAITQLCKSGGKGGGGFG